jgi:hypothetical protein
MNLKNKTPIISILRFECIGLVEEEVRAQPPPPPQVPAIRGPTFVEYLKSGLELNFAVAIDFTASNGKSDYSALMKLNFLIIEPLVVFKRLHLPSTF